MATDYRAPGGEKVNYVVLVSPSDGLPYTASGADGGGGDATAGKQDIGNASLASIDGKTPTLVSGRVPVDGSGATQPISSTAIGATNDSAASSDTGTFSVISLIKRGLQNWTTLLARIATLSNNSYPVTDALNLAGNARADLALATTGAHTASVLTAGRYAVSTSADCFIKVNATANDVTTSNGYPLKANTVEFLNFSGSERLGGITATGTATLSYHKVS